MDMIVDNVDCCSDKCPRVQRTEEESDGQQLVFFKSVSPVDCCIDSQLVQQSNACAQSVNYGLEISVASKHLCCIDLHVYMTVD